MNTKDKITKYISDWKNKGYCTDIPDEVPDILMDLKLAPSYKAIALCLLKNDMHLEGLGFSAPSSSWYSYLKRIELKERGVLKD